MIKTAVIMAAGLGGRFGSYTEHIPKAFVPCGGVPMIERSVRTLLDSGMERIIIGTGYHKECFEPLERRFPQIECVYSPLYAKTNSMYTLYHCREAVGADDFLLLESDLVYEKRAISLLLDCEEETVMLITPETKFQDQYYVAYDKSRQLTGCSTEKSLVEARGEMVGIHKLSNAFYRAMCRDYGARADAEPRLGYEYELLSMARGGSRVYVLNVPGLLWYEIDDPDDLSYAQQFVIPHLEKYGNQA